MTDEKIPVNPLLHDHLLTKLYSALEMASSIPTGISRASFIEAHVPDSPANTIDEKRYKTILLFLRDLFAQGWDLTIQNQIPYLLYPVVPDSLSKKEWYRKALLHEREKHVNTPSVKRFISKMERLRCFNKRKTSIRDLIANSELLHQHVLTLGTTSIIPYVQIIDSDRDRDYYTGLKLMDIWRYFRLTWTLPYKPTPGRSLLLLVRDSGQENHPVIGIAALGNSIVQISCRDNLIGWTLDSLTQRTKDLNEDSAEKILNSLSISINKALVDIYSDDLLPDGTEITTDFEVISKLYKIAAEMIDGEPSKRPAEQLNFEELLNLSKTPLYKKKRARTLAELLRAKAVFQEFYSQSALDSLHHMIKTKNGQFAISVALKANKKEKIGANMMDIIVCGAIPPYSYLLGGKLVSLLMMSPEITQAYETRYKERISVIASGMKGAPVVRDSRLVFLGTTSLYESGSSQYNRLFLPQNLLGNEQPSKKIGYQVLGLTKGYGTVYVSDKTANAMSDLIQTVHGRQLISTTFGEGTSPRLRLIRTGLDLLGMPSNSLLKHNFKRIVYGIELAENTREFLKGEEQSPNYYLDQENPEAVTQYICNYWRERWLSKRIKNPSVLEKVKEFEKEDFLIGNGL